MKTLGCSLLTALLLIFAPLAASAAERSAAPLATNVLSCEDDTTSSGEPVRRCLVVVYSASFTDAARAARTDSIDAFGPDYRDALTPEHLDRAWQNEAHRIVPQPAYGP